MMGENCVVDTVLIGCWTDYCMHGLTCPALILTPMHHNGGGGWGGKFSIFFKPSFYKTRKGSFISEFSNTSLDKTVYKETSQFSFLLTLGLQAVKKGLAS